MNYKKEKDKELLVLIKEIFFNNYEKYGYLRVTQELKNQGYNVNKKKVQRLMKENNLLAKPKKRSYHSYRGIVGDIAPNIIDRDFIAFRPYEKAGTDVTVFITQYGKLYLSPILDMFDSSIIAYDISTTPDFEQIKRMLSKAFSENTNLDGLIFHSDQGWQYQMKQYKQMLQEKQIKQSFSRKGNCMDNSLMENFFGIIKNEMFYGHEEEFETINDLRLAIENYIKWYNEDRINVKRKGLSPLQYRQQSFLNL